MGNKISGVRSTILVTREELETMHSNVLGSNNEIIREKLLEGLIEQIRKHADLIPIEYSQIDSGLYGKEFVATIYFDERRGL